ncbi:hypothetical protein PCASD_09270 [Puccinia coronata f. sp. avenae]|uniref:Uncharacterized protein n=1 Tax=Puccinia coronata f. sp. avenae TaxID=200324 RepID=A0A2N5TFJ2_9BASI|nr:hypothetical protein PCASD_09270 [Puccinia coronata f. sp. avenae]
MIPWRHKGKLLAQPIVALLKKKGWHKKLLAQTTNSGSNNNMMAKKMEELFQLSDSSSTPSKTKQSVLGFFLVLGKLIEEDKPDEESFNATLDGSLVTKTALDCEDDNDNDYPNADDEGSVGEEPTGTENDDDSFSLQPENSSQLPQLKELTTKLNKVIKTITQSAAQQSNFHAIAKRLNLKVKPLIAGYGIRWNVKYCQP